MSDSRTIRETALVSILQGIDTLAERLASSVQSDEVGGGGEAKDIAPAIRDLAEAYALIVAPARRSSSA